MRNLSDWESSKVLFEGFIENWNPNPSSDSAGNILLTSVSLKLIEKSEKRYFEHIWIRNYPAYRNIEDKLERLTKVFGNATVVKYRRKNNTIDYGIDYIGGKYCIQKLMYDLNLMVLKNSPRKKIKTKVLFILELLNSKNFISNTLDFDYEECLFYVNKIINKIKNY